MPAGKEVHVTARIMNNPPQAPNARSGDDARRDEMKRFAKGALPRSVALILLVGLPIACSDPRESARIFEDVTVSSGLASLSGITYGAFWGDFDGDGLPDLYVTNHLNGAKLYRNLGKGRFADVTDQWFAPADLLGDKHGAAWGDFDNDGRLDLVQLTGAERGVGTEAKRLFINRGGRFENIAEAAGVANPFGRTRMPLWFDFDNDGRLDLFEGAEVRFDDRAPPFVFLQKDGKFEAANEIAPFASRSVPFCIVTDLTSDGSPQLVCRVAQSNRTAQVFSTKQLPFKELPLLPVTAFEDIAAGDFDNDGFIDVYLARKNPAPPVSIARPSVNEIITDVVIDQKIAGKQLGFSFRSPGEIKFRVAPESPGNPLTPAGVHIGSLGSQPSELSFALSPDTAGVGGLPSFQQGESSGVYIGFTPPDQWQVLFSISRDALAADRKWHETAVRVTSSEPVSDLKTIGESDSPEEAPGRLFMNRDGKLVEESEKRGINARAISAVNVVAGDFNNDMYLDLFVVASGDVGKQENLLLINRGDGHFTVMPGAGGAGGPRMGVGDSVTTADFDGDGFLDILITTGGSMGRSLGLPSEAGSYHLYHNVGNGNHWLEIDLEGTKSNRDGIGARVQLTAGGVTQVRIQDGGVHYRGQNHSRIHFGLAKNTRADKITIRWPSGTVQELTDVQADRLIRVRETGDR
jgi:hypothetical protein